MIAEAGHAALWLAAAFAILAAIGPRSAAGPEVVLPSLVIAALLAVTALVALIWCFEAADFSVVLVDAHVHRLQPPVARLAALLRSGAGWLTLLCALLGAVALVTTARWPALATRSALTFAAPLVALLAVDPFARQPIAPPEGRALWLPEDMTAALFQPSLLAIGIALLVAVALHGSLPKPPRWAVAGAGLALVVVIALPVVSSTLSVETHAVLRPGETMRLQGVEAELLSLAPTAGAGFSAIEATLRISSGGDPTLLRPQARMLTYSRAETTIPASTHFGTSRVEALLGPATDRGRLITLRWSPLP